jgi:hypothetical protein
MRHAALLLLAGLFIFALVMALGAPATSTVEADDLLQDMTRLDGQKIYFTEAGKEPSRFDRSSEGASRFAGLLELLGADLHTLEWRNGIPGDANLVVIFGPTSDLTGDQIAWLWSYMQDGAGRLLLLADPFAGSTRALSRRSPLMDLMWTDLGFTAEDTVVALLGDVITIAPTPAPGRGDEPTGTPAPAFDSATLSVNFMTSNLSASHPITAGLQGDLAFFEARSLEVDSTLREADATVLAFSDTNFYGESDYNDFLKTNFVEYNVDEDRAQGSLPLAVAYDNPVLDTRIVLIGDADFARNGLGFQTSPPYSSSFLYPNNVRFMLNSVAWLLDAEQVQLSFPTPGPTVTPVPTASPIPLPAADDTAQ